MDKSANIKKFSSTRLVTRKNHTYHTFILTWNITNGIPGRMFQVNIVSILFTFLTTKISIFQSQKRLAKF